MSQRHRSGDHGKHDREAQRPEKACAAVRARLSPRSWLLALGTVAALLGAGWLGVRTVRNNAARDAVSALQPVAPSVAPDPPERREALEIADRLLRDYPASPEALYVRGIVLARYGFNDEAVNTWKACLKLFPDLAPVCERLGMDALQRGKSEQAVELLQKAFQLDPESSVAGLGLGETLNSLGRMSEAVPVLRQYLEKSPHSAHSAEAYFQLGQAYMYLQDYARAKECHQAALREDPEYAQACYGLAVACGRLGEADQSRQHREKYAEMIAESRVGEQRRVRQNRDDAERQEGLARAYATAGQIYLDHGRIQEARELWSKASAINPRLEFPNVSGADEARAGQGPAPAGR
jgi:tetratricopeptide (TPR) repeat protein